MTWGRIVTVACGVLLILDGFIGLNVRAAAVLVGLVLVGALPLSWITDALAASRGRAHEERHEDPS